MLDIYLPSGYVNIKGILALGFPFNFIWGARGTGKTYGVLLTALEENRTIMYTRTKQVQIDLVRTPEFFPYKAINEDTGANITASPINKMTTGFYRGKEQDGRLIPDGAPIGYSSALSTMANLRGIGASDIDLWFYDEFIPEREEKTIKNAGYAFFNAYETINRNRELQGKPPLQVVCASNSENVYNDIMIQLGIVTKAAQMNRDKQTFSFMKDRGIALFNLTDSPISERKKETSLYKAVGADSDFFKMAIENDFYSLDYSDISSKNMQEYRPICKLGELVIYEHKSGDSLYISSKLVGSVQDTFPANTRGIRAFKRQYMWVLSYYMSYDITFENVESKLLFESYLKY